MELCKIIRNGHDYAALFARLPHLHCLIDRTGALLLVSPSWEKTLGWSDEELLSDAWLTRVHSEDQSIVLSILNAVAISTPTACFNHRIFCKDNAEKWLSWTVQALPDELHLIATVRDITEQKQREEILVRDKERLERAIRGTRDGLWEWNIVTGDVYLSARFKELLGFADNELPNHTDSFFSRVHPDDLQGAVTATPCHLKERTPFEIDIRLLAKSGDYRWYGRVE